MKKREVVIDGKVYVPATEALPSIDNIMQALWESYMGTGERWNEGTNAQSIWVTVNEDQEGDTFEEFAARIAAVYTATSKENSHE